MILKTTKKRIRSREKVADVGSERKAVTRQLGSTLSDYTSTLLMTIDGWWCWGAELWTTPNNLNPKKERKEMVLDNLF